MLFDALMLIETLHQDVLMATLTLRRRIKDVRKQKNQARRN